MRIWPGGTIGILGGGQLARMLALEALRMGYRIAVVDPDPEGPAMQIAHVRVPGAFDDPRAAKRLAEKSDVITLDTEHIPAWLLQQLEAMKPVRPSANVLRIVQDRLEQRGFLEAQGVPQVRYAPVSDVEGLYTAVKVTGFPCVLKARRSGYDGKGQVFVGHPDELEGAWRDLGGAPAVMESFVDFEREISVLLARDLGGNLRFYPIAENVHRRHILHLTRVPARISARLASQAQELGAQIASALGHIGMMAIEFFVTGRDELLVNEIAPRVHNSGHYSFGACVTSQFEQHVRAVCGLPLGTRRSYGPPSWSTCSETSGPRAPRPGSR
ncbi:MAG: 5-(carboxyamino)imidazole ribonucleotide synthase [Gemmataceae bacterium]